MSVSSKVEIFLNKSEKESFTVNEIVHFLADQRLVDPEHDVRKLRHTVYQKLSRLVKQGDVELIGSENRESVYKRPGNDRKIEESTNMSSTVKTLIKRKKLLESRVIEHIAEAKGYDELKDLLPNNIELLEELKATAKEECLSLNGQLASIEVVLRRLGCEHA